MDMTTDQKEIYDTIRKTRTTGVQGPFKAWLGCPAICDAAQNLGRVCRYELQHIDRCETELVILMTAIRHKSKTEYTIHRGEALKVGLTESVVDALWNPFDAPVFASDRHAIVHEFAAAVLVDSSAIPQGLYNRAQDALGAEALVEITSLIGYYVFVALTLNTFNIVPEGDAVVKSGGDGKNGYDEEERGARQLRCFICQLETHTTDQCPMKIPSLPRDSS